MGKKNIRKQFLERRKQLDHPTYFHLSQKVQQRLIAAECFARAEVLALYSPINNEVATEQIFTAARSGGKKIYYPRVVGDDLDFFEVKEEAELQPGTFGVAEPTSEERISLAELDLVVVPGVAFDLHGYRLGYGRGFYDRRLVEKLAKTVSVGLCFDFQLCESLPVEGHDQSLNFITTETKFFPCHS